MAEDTKATDAPTFDEALRDHHFSTDEEVADALADDPERVADPKEQAEFDDVPPVELALSEGKIFGVAPQALVRGGTRTSDHDSMIAEQTAEGDHRRAQADMDTALARVPVERGGGQMHQHKFTNIPDTQEAKLVLVWLNRHGNPNGREGLCEILAAMNPIFTGEMAIEMICAYCVSQGDKPWDSIMQVRQANAHWELDQRTAGELIPYQDAEQGIIMVPSPGLVTSERFKCPKCALYMRIDCNRVWPDGWSP